MEGDFFGAADLYASACLDRSNEAARIVQAFMGAGVEPGISSPQPLHGEFSPVEVNPVDIRDVEFAPGRGLQGLCNV